MEQIIWDLGTRCLVLPFGVQRVRLRVSWMLLSPSLNSLCSFPSLLHAYAACLKRETPFCLLLVGAVSLPLNTKLDRRAGLVTNEAQDGLIICKSPWQQDFVLDLLHYHGGKALSVRCRKRDPESEPAFSVDLLKAIFLTSSYPLKSLKTSHKLRTSC